MTFGFHSAAAQLGSTADSLQRTIIPLLPTKSVFTCRYSDRRVFPPRTVRGCCERLRSAVTEVW
jgi:hypothetical protein